MQLVIDIPEEIYNEVCWRGLSLCPRDEANLVKAIRNSTPLPKGHGRLIDADVLYETSRLCHTEEDGTACVEWREINDAPTIIEGSDIE
jgi:hypothetical protein